MLKKLFSFFSILLLLPLSAFAAEEEVFEGEENSVVEQVFSQGEQDLTPNPSPEEERGEEDDEETNGKQDIEESLLLVEGSGEQEENIEEPETIKLETKIEFQRPSYLLEKDEEAREEYTCYPEKEECKVNLKFLAFLGGEELTASKYICETSFGFESEEENNCNPNTVIFPVGNYEVKYKIILKSDESIFEEGSFVVKNSSPLVTLPEAEGNSSGEDNEEETGEEDGATSLPVGETEGGQEGEVGEENNDSESSSEGQQNTEQESSILPELDLQIQSGADFGEDSVILCPEQGEDICKINFTLGDIGSDFACAFDYGLGEAINQEGECNPGYVDFPAGTYEMKVKIFEKHDVENVVEKTFEVNNEKLVFVEEDGEEREQDTASNSEEEAEQDLTPNPSPDEERGEENNGEDSEEDGAGNLLIQSGADFSSDDASIILCPEERVGICKINFLVEGGENCEFDFGLESQTGDEQKCNPGYIDFPVGDTVMSLKIGDEIQKYIIKNSLVEREFDLILTRQTPDYLLDTDDENSFTCDRSKKTCKVNFDLRESFGGESASKFSCQHIFSFGTTTEDEKCNPNTIEIPLGNHSLEFTMTSGITKKTKTIQIKNEGYIVEAKNTSSKSIETITIPDNEIIVQSGLDENLTCNKKECKVNFDYDLEDIKGLKCEWDFGEAQYNEASAKKCNPGYVTYGPGKHSVSLKIYQKDKTSNYLEKQMSFTNIYEKQELKAKIDLQGRLVKYKKYFVDKIFCNGVKSCKLNFDGSSSQGEIENYHWDFGNGEIYEGKNPKIVEFFPGEYEVTLQVTDEEGNTDTKVFFIYVSEEEKTQEEVQNYILSFFGDIVTFKNEFAQWYDNWYFFQNKKLFDDARMKKEEQLKLYLRKNKKSATVYGKAEPGSMIIISEKSDVLFWKGLFIKNQYEVQVDEEGKFKQKIVYDEVGNFTVQALLEDEKLGEIDFEKEKYFSVDDTGSIPSNPTKTNFPLKGEGNMDDKNIFEPVAIASELQGKIGKNKIVNGKNITCLGTCAINLKSSSTGSIASESWDFGNGVYSDRVNPKSVKYEVYGNYTITHIITNNYGESYAEYWYVKFTPKPKKARKKKSKKVKIGPVQLKIEVQGKIGTTKKLEPGKLTCYKTCKVNFDGRSSSGAYKELLWDFGNEQYFSGENPGYIEYKDPGNYTVILKAEGYDQKWYTTTFSVVFEKEILESENVSVEGGESPEGKKETIENMLVEKREYSKLDIFYLSLIFVITLGGGSVSFGNLRKEY